MHQNPHLNSHTPVLLKEVIDIVQPKKGDSYLDTTAGRGGHAQEILNMSENYPQSVLVDRDSEAITNLANKFKNKSIQLMHQDYLSASRELLETDRRFDIILADLGVSSPHINEVSRGFSFASDGPLDMRMDQRQETIAWDIVNKTDEGKLANILREYGEEPKNRQIAKIIVRNRPINTTIELAALTKQAWPGHSRSHPATRTFQAIRIVVNNELEQLSEALPIWLELLKPNGRLAIITFHSLEDRIVKKFFANESGDRFDSKLSLLTKHPVVPDPHETAHNPRAHSAKLRVAVKQKGKGNANAYSG